MSERPLPKSLLAAIARRPERFEDGWSEQDGFGNRPGQWAHWVYLAPGWRNAVLDPLAPLHIIHECTVEECIAQFNGALPCDCEECVAWAALNAAPAKQEVGR